MGGQGKDACYGWFSKNIITELMAETFKGSENQETSPRKPSLSYTMAFVDVMILLYSFILIATCTSICK